MHYRLLLIFSLIFLVSCKQSIKETDLYNLNGYWEIEKVILPDGEEKEYKVSDSYDFFKFENKKGFRKKMMPQVDGSYLTNGIEETFTITNEEGKYYINYSTQYAKWKEEILNLSKEELIVKNKSDLEYHYKRPIPFAKK